MLNGDDIMLDFLPENKNYLLMVRFSEFKNHEQRTLGVIGFCCDDDLSDKPQGLLARRLLMLLRRDIGKFIIDHHKNDEFSALRALESIRRFTYLAGHGRQSMLRLTREDERLAIERKDESLFKDTIGTMDKLQYLYASNILNGDDGAKKLEKTFLPSDIGSDKTLEDTIKKYIERIYTSDAIENKVTICPSSDNSAGNFDTLWSVSVNIGDRFMFSRDILLFILFEFIINGKKNRWHCLNSDKARYEKCKNQINITISLDKENNESFLRIEIVTIGTEVAYDIREKISKGKPVKDGNMNEGLFLISTILREYNSENSITMADSLPIETAETGCGQQCRLWENTFIIKINQAE
jgi:hypothetical protein